MSTADAKRKSMDEWMDAHPRKVGFSVKHVYAYCLDAGSQLGLDSAGQKVVEGLKACKSCVIPVAVKVLKACHSHLHYDVQASVVPHRNVSVFRIVTFVQRTLPLLFLDLDVGFRMVIVLQLTRFHYHVLA